MVGLNAIKCMTPPNGSQQLVQKLWNYYNVLRDVSHKDAAGLPDPDIIAAEITKDLRAALEQFEAILTDLARA